MITAPMVAEAPPSVILIHGWPLSGRMWYQQVAALSASFRVVTLDLPGFGGTPPGAESSMSSLAFALEEFMARSRIEEAALVGWSMGAGVVMRYCEEIGTDKLWAVALIEDSPRLSPDVDWPEGEFTTFAPSVVESWFEAWRAGRRAEVLREIFVHGFTEPERHEAVIHELVREGLNADPECALETFRDAVRVDFRVGLRSIGVPTKLIFGAGSQMSTPSVREYMATTIPDCELDVLDGCGHCLLWEEPDAVNQVLQTFLERSARSRKERS